MIQLSHIHLTLPGFALEDINLTIEQGDFFSLIGPTGSGKSLLLEGMMGLMPFTSGQLILDGTDISRLPVENRGFALVYQDFALFPHLDVTRNICYGIPYHDISKKEADTRMEKLVATLGLERILNRRPHTLSGGEKQRVALARSLILNPKVLLLDEPLSALDPVFHNGAKQLLKKIHDQLGITIVMVSHNFQDVIYLADRGAIINGGRVVQQGDILSLFQRPGSRFAADFVGMKNIWAIERDGDRIRPAESSLGFWAASGPQKGHTHMGIRPEDILPVSPNGEKQMNRFQGQIRNIAGHGAFLEVDIQVESLVFQALWHKSSLREYGLEPGQGIEIFVHPESIHTFRGEDGSFFNAGSPGGS